MSIAIQNESRSLFQAIDSALLREEKPSHYIMRTAYEGGFKNPPYTMLLRMRDTPQRPDHHPEGSVWNHTMLVLDEAAAVKSRSCNPRVFMWAALLHDVGKPETTQQRNGRITSYGHDKQGAVLTEAFLSALTDDPLFIRAVSRLVRWHMQILFVTKDKPTAKPKAMRREVDIQEVALLGLCDRLGRLHADREREEANIRLFLEKAVL